ncbi:HNH endonuclease [Altererythrobacter luteolus]|uniref:HNH endonuclease n=1 Tax=Pontixanthobacter luteolus TaxID=295089 RepID=A0A6I4V331_9SPHN|nr:HNH endonuclease [Pontixanthobacter luteolus]MXP47436.1 HNH endonuclease [Pontixanthobacter luteolus]
MNTLESIKPKAQHSVFDLAEEAGFDVSDWIASSNDTRGHKANPKYCYEWSFIEPGRLIILNLWHAAMREEDGRITTTGNFRKDADYYRTVVRKAQWAERAQKLDEALQVALKDNLPVRVIMLDGKQRDKNDPDRKPSKVAKRELDSEPWTITAYDWETGQCELARGVFTQQCVDQFDLDQVDKASPKRTEATSQPFVRDPAVRRNVLRRSKGHCELCGQRGFLMVNGALYLETHHVIPLSEGGPDTEHNVVALCADDHRRAHYASDRDGIAANLKSVVNERL